jgi:hypothetical protein
MSSVNHRFMRPLAFKLPLAVALIAFGWCVGGPILCVGFAVVIVYCELTHVKDESA